MQIGLVFHDVGIVADVARRRVAAIVDEETRPRGAQARTSDQNVRKRERGTWDSQKEKKTTSKTRSGRHENRSATT